MSQHITLGGKPDSRGFFGAYGGQYVPEPVKARLDELSGAFDAALNDASFQRELEYLFVHYTGRPSPVFHCANLSRMLGGAQIWLKREDLNHLGAHKINNTLGQCLLAKRMGKKRVIAETGAGQHGVATAAGAALNAFNKELLASHIRTCVVEDIRDGKDEVIDELVATLQKLMK